MTGWMSTLSWQAGTASGSFLTGTIIQGLITVNNPDYAPEPYQGTLLVFAMVLVIFIANIWGAKSLPVVQNVLFVVHCFGFFAVIIVLWVLAPRNSAKKVFTEFTNEGGWSSMGVSLMVGQISAIYGSICKFPHPTRTPLHPPRLTTPLLTHVISRFGRYRAHG
jgi:amino acid transporter